MWSCRKRSGLVSGSTDPRLGIAGARPKISFAGIGLLAQNILIDGYHALEAELILQPPSHKAGEVNYIALVATDTREYVISAYGVDREQWKKFLSSITFD